MSAVFDSPDLKAEQIVVEAKVMEWIHVLKNHQVDTLMSPARHAIAAAAINLLVMLYRAPHRYAKPRPLDDVIGPLVGQDCTVTQARKAARTLKGMGAVSLKEPKTGPADATLELILLPPWPMT